jgi:uncharacterized protein YggU (UPF0235/DUF167 family)
MALTALSGAGAASAQSIQQSDPNPLSTNIPYLAWRGEHVRLVKCEGDLPGTDMEALRAAPRLSDGGLSLHVRTDVIVEDWSGDPAFKPSVAAGTVDLFLTDDGLCVKADVLSQRAGLAQIKLMVTLDPGNDSGIVDAITRSEILGVHQFLSGWMTLGTPGLVELPVGGDATSLDRFDASDAPSHDGVLDVTVSGTIPLQNGFETLGLGGTATLPADWPALARALASDRNPDNSDPAYRWDIHDGMTAAEGHGTPCPVADIVGDAVDNCAGGLSFSRWFDADGPAGPIGPIDLGRTSPDSIGPFDPQRPDETLLGDGQLTADDAPMPAARIDVSIAGNAGGTDTAGIGSLHKSSKREFFSRDRAEGANAGSGADSAHNLFAPFYSAYIPATADGSFLLGGTPVSGTDGPAVGNDFPGFLVGDGNGGEGDFADYDNTYNYWDIAHVFRSSLGTPTTCLNRMDESPARRLTPLGAQSVAVYTDEHGHAQVAYRPGTGAYYDNLPVIRNANGGCDLKNVTTLGTSAISAAAKYPYQPTTDIAPKVSTTITKTVRSLFAKYLTQWPKGDGDDNAATRIVVAHAQDVDGSPEVGETVCFIKSTAAGAVQPYVHNGYNDRYVGGYDLAGSALVDDSRDDIVCMRTNAAGNAAIEVTDSEGELVDITGDFVAEAIRRPFPVNFGAAVPAPQPQGPGPVHAPGQGETPGTVTDVPPANAAGNATATPQQDAKVDAILGQTAKGVAKKSGAVVVRFAHLRVSAKGQRSLMVRLDGGSSAKVRIKLFDKKGKARVKVIRRLAAGKTVKVSGLTISKQIVRASIKVIG